MSSVSVHASSSHHTRERWWANPNFDNVDTLSCDVSALAERKPAEGDRLQRGEILHSASGMHENALVKDKTKVWLRKDCRLVVYGKYGYSLVDLFVSNPNPEKQADHCALVLTDASCSTQGDLAIIDTDTGKYLWRVKSSLFTPEVDVFQAVGTSKATLFQEGGHKLWSTYQNRNYPGSKGFFYFDLEVREDVHSLHCDAGALQSSYKQASDNYVLLPRRILRAGTSLTTYTGFELRMQDDCNLVVYRGGQAIFATRTMGKGTEGKCALVVTAEGCDTQGDMAIVDSASGQYVWRVPASLMDPGADTLFLQDDGDVVLYLPGGPIVWRAGSSNLDSPHDDSTFGNGRKMKALHAAIEGAAPPRCDPQALAKRPAAKGDSLWENEVLAMGQSLRPPDAGKKEAVTVKDDCVLEVLNNDGNFAWRTHTQGKAKKCALVITGEECDRAGDLALVDMDSGAYLWHTDTSYVRPTARVMYLWGDDLILFQDGTFYRMWKSRPRFDGPPYDRHEVPKKFRGAFEYMHQSQDA